MEMLAMFGRARADIEDIHMPGFETKFMWIRREAVCKATFRRCRRPDNRSVKSVDQSHHRHNEFNSCEDRRHGPDDGDVVPSLSLSREALKNIVEPCVDVAATAEMTSDLRLDEVIPNEAPYPNRTLQNTCLLRYPILQGLLLTSSRCKGLANCVPRDDGRNELLRKQTAYMTTKQEQRIFFAQFQPLQHAPDSERCQGV
ncbi:hypothetical protein EDD85DRAFT_784426 [Armillaria nabsnona]|nr:hypothetical protein EDD85DRAFT_798968 [Armillaria nabsnona]KAK0243897.1 hypothetical protein EDD85DRAFT_784426 [Armillaria nabsnona]